MTLNHLPTGAFDNNAPSPEREVISYFHMNFRSSDLLDLQGGQMPELELSCRGWTLALLLPAP